MSTNNMTLDERIKLLEAYLAAFNRPDIPYGYGSGPKEYLETCNKLKALGAEWGDKLPKEQFSIVKGKALGLFNRATSYSFDPDTYYVKWDTDGIGRLMFVNEKFWFNVQEEWDAFTQKLASFNPLDYDPINNEYVYSIEQGKKLMAAYPDIYNETRAAISAKTKEIKKKQLLQQLEDLNKEGEFNG